MLQVSVLRGWWSQRGGTLSMSQSSSYFKHEVHNVPVSCRGRGIARRHRDSTSGLTCGQVRLWLAQEDYLTARTISLGIILYMVRNKMLPVNQYMPLAHRSVILRCLDAHHIGRRYLTLLSRLQGKVDYLT
jgi:hypothetical protein